MEESPPYETENNYNATGKLVHVIGATKRDSIIIAPLHHERRGRVYLGPVSPGGHKVRPYSPEHVMSARERII